MADSTISGLAANTAPSNSAITVVVDGGVDYKATLYNLVKAGLTGGSISVTTGNISASGSITAGSATAGTPGAGDAFFSNSVSSGRMYLGGSASQAIVDFGNTTAGKATISQPLNVVGNLATTSTANTGSIQFGSSSTLAGVWDFDSIEFRAKTTAGLWAPIAAGTTITSGAGNAAGFVPPFYTASGAGAPTTIHGVSGTVSTASGSISVTLTNAAVFNSGTSFAVFATVVNGSTNLLSSTQPVVITSASSFTINFAGSGGTNVANWVAIGY